MAITAIDAVVTDVVFVAELDRLAARDTDLRHIGRPINRRERGNEDNDDGSAPEYAHPGNSVRAAVKNLRHARMFFDSVGASFQSQKFVQKGEDAFVVIPAKAGIQKSLKCLDSGSR